MSTWCAAHGHWTNHAVRLGRCTDKFPVHPPEPMYCDCSSYVPELIPLFATSQCAWCGRPERVS